MGSKAVKAGLCSAIDGTRCFLVLESMAESGSSSKRARTVATKRHTSCFAMTRPGQCVLPPPNGWKPLVLAKSLLRNQRSALKDRGSWPKILLLR